MTIVVSHAARSSVDPASACAAPLRPLEAERQRDDADGERAELPRDPRDHRRSAGAGAAALARGDEDHVGAAKRVLDLVVRLLGGPPADLGIGARAEALRELAADVDLGRRVGHVQLLDVGVDGDELDLGDARVDHPVERVQPGAADADDADDREVRRGVAARRAVDARRGLRERRTARRAAAPARRRLGALAAAARLRGSGLFATAPARRRSRPTPPRSGRARPSARAARRPASRPRLLAPAVVLALSSLGRAEELRERALTHRRALSRHCEHLLGQVAVHLSRLARSGRISARTRPSRAPPRSGRSCGSSC